MIYLPIEIPKREIIGKVLFACFLASKGRSSLIFEHTFFDRYKWPYRGTYVGKNCFRDEPPSDLKWYKKQKKNYIDTFFLDDEGGIYNGDNEKDFFKVLKRRLDPSVLDGRDKIFTWGSIQKKFYNKKKYKPKIIETGYPTFEFLSKKYQKFLKNFDNKITGKRSNFILVNTRFCEINPKKKLENLLGDKSGQKIKKIELISELKRSSVLLSCYVDSIYKLSNIFKNIKFIIRPHPEENSEIYDFFLGQQENIEVIDYGPVESWIRQSKLVITYGCTTGLQAMLAEKPLIIYEPTELKKTKFDIPLFVNNLGQKAKNLEELIKFINKPIIKKSSFWKKYVNPHDVSEKILKEIPLNQILNKNYLLNLFGFIENIKIFFKTFFKFNNQIFDKEKLFDEIPMLVKESSKIFNKKILYKKISQNVYEISSI